jgi:integrase
VGSARPTDIQGWQRWLQDRGVSQNYRVLLFTHVASIFNKRILENPCHAKSVTQPRAEQKKIEVWLHERARAVKAALPDRYKIVVPVEVGSGLRQGEVLGLSPEDLDREAEEINIVRQIRIVENKPVFAPPKRGKVRSVPLSSRVVRELDAYAERFPPTELTLPWTHPGGKLVTARVYLVDYDGRPHAGRVHLAGMASGTA